jgi:hypothetical protein
MAGLTVAETASNVVIFTGSWTTFLGSLSAWGSDQNPDTKKAVVASATALISATTALANTPGFTALSQVTGVVTIVSTMNDDIAVYNAATTVNDQNRAIAQLVNDTAGLGGGVATAVGSIATLAGKSALAEIMESVATRATELGAIAVAVQVGTDIGQWFNSTYLPGLNKFLGLDTTKQDEDMLLNMSGPNGGAEIIMAGQVGDVLVGSPFQYSETGALPGEVQVAETSSDSTYISGQDVLLDSDNSDISLNGVVNGQVNGSGNNYFISTSAGNTAMLSGGNNTLSISGSAGGSAIILTSTGGTADSLNLDGASDATIILGDSGVSVDISGTDSNVNVSMADGGVLIGVAGNNITLNGDNLVFDANEGGYTLTGDDNKINLAAGVSVTVDAGSGDVVTNTKSGENFSLSTASLGPYEYDDPIISNGTTGFLVGSSNLLDQDTFTANSDGTTTIQLSADGGYETETMNVNSSGQATTSYLYLGGVLNTYATYTYGGGILVGENVYYADGRFLETEQLNPGGTLLSATQYDEAGNVTAEFWGTPNSETQVDISEGVVEDSTVFTDDGATTNSVSYDGSGQEYGANSINLQTGSDIAWLASAGDAYAREESIAGIVAPSGAEAYTQDTLFDSSTGEVTQSTIYGEFDASGVATTKEILTSDGGLYFSEDDTYNYQTGQLIDSVTYDSMSGQIIAYTGSVPSGSAVATSGYVDQTTSVFSGEPEGGAVSVASADLTQSDFVKSTVIAEGEGFDLGGEPEEAKAFQNFRHASTSVVLAPVGDDLASDSQFSKLNDLLLLGHQRANDNSYANGITDRADLLLQMMAVNTSSSSSATHFIDHESEYSVLHFSVHH